MLVFLHSSVCWTVVFRLVCCWLVCLFLLFAVYVCFNVQCVRLSTHAINKRQLTYLLTYFITMSHCNAFKCLVADIWVISRVLISRSVNASSSLWRSGSVHLQMLLVVHWLSFQWSLISVKLCVFTFDPKGTWITWLKLRNVDFRVF